MPRRRSTTSSGLWTACGSNARRARTSSSRCGARRQASAALSLVSPTRTAYRSTRAVGSIDGLKGKRTAAQRAASRSVRTIALHVGDFDDYGKWIFKAKAEDVALWVPSYTDDDRYWTCTIESERIALMADLEVVLDVRRLAVTEAQVAAGLVELDDNGKAEQLPADWEILSDVLDDLLDPARRNEVLAREDDERDRLRELIAARWSA